MISSYISISERDHLTDETIVDLLDRLCPDRGERPLRTGHRDGPGARHWSVSSKRNPLGLLASPARQRSPRYPDLCDRSHFQYLKPLPQKHSDISACRLFLDTVLMV